MKTYSIKSSDIKKDWYLIDADNVVLGRLASFIALRLRGKHKPTYTPHMNCGDNIIVINAKKVHLTGKKKEKKVFHWHTGYPGGLKQCYAKDILEGDYPERILYKAVERMLPKGPLGRLQLKSLKIYNELEHPHKAQNPKIISFSEINDKNKKRNLK